MNFIFKIISFFFTFYCECRFLLFSNVKKIVNSKKNHETVEAVQCQNLKM